MTADPVPNQPRPKKMRRHRAWQDGLNAVMKPAGESPGSAEVDVGRRLRELRGAQGLSMRALAELSGLNFNTLSLIENNHSSPSVSTLQQLAQALKVPITAFFESLQPKKQVVLQRSGQRRGAAFACGMLEDLGGGMTLRGGQPLLVTMSPQADSGPDPIVHTGSEFVYCLEGCLAYQVDHEDYLLQPGDSLLFEAHLPHCWRNPGKTASRSLLILCPDDEHDPSTERHFAAQDGQGGTG